MVNFLSRRAGANLACKFRTPAVLCGPNPHNRAKHTTPKQIISVNTRNNKIYPRMTYAKGLLFNVTLLVRPGLEPKIARFGGPHGVSCGRGFNPRHGPLQVPALTLSRHVDRINYLAENVPFYTRNNLQSYPVLLVHDITPPACSRISGYVSGHRNFVLLPACSNSCRWSLFRHESLYFCYC
jgi:hypothetical protein